MAAKSRFFWQVPECIKFRIIFENEETVVGINDRNEYRLFRKDIDRIGFSEREAIEICLRVFIRDGEMEPEKEGLPV